MKRALYGILSACFLLSVHPSRATSICSNLSFMVQLGVLDAKSISQLTNDLTIAAGVPIAVRIAAKNNGQAPLLINLNNLQLTNRRNGFIVSISEAGEQVDSPILLPQGPEMDHPVTLQPGEEREGTIVLTSYFPKLTRPGRFDVRVSYNWEWGFYILTCDGSKHPYERVHVESDVLHLVVTDNLNPDALNGPLAVLQDGDYGAHFVYALVNSSANDAMTPTAKGLHEWRDSYVQLYVDALYARYPKKANQIVQSIVNAASSNSLAKLNKALAKNKESAKSFAPAGQKVPGGAE